MKTDLLSAPCAAGETVKTGVNLPVNNTVSDLELTSNFEVVEVTQQGCWYEVKARNLGTEEARFTADITYGEVVDEPHPDFGPTEGPFR